LEEDRRSAKLALEQQRAQFEDELAVLKDEKTKFESNFSESQKKHQNDIVQERRNSHRFIEQREAELAERESLVARQEQGLEDLKQQGLQLKQQIGELRETVSARDQQIQTEERKLNYMKAQHQEVVASNAQLMRSNDELEAKIGELQNQMETVHSMSVEKRHELRNRLRILKERHKQDMDALSAQVQSKVLVKLRTVEEDVKAKAHEANALQAELERARQEKQRFAEKICSEEKKRKENSQVADDLRVENERLRNLMREKTDGLRGSETAASELRRLRDLLDLEPNSPPEAVVDAVAYVLSHRKRR
jgi:chromosome segregation ATPase